MWAGRAKRRWCFLWRLPLCHSCFPPGCPGEGHHLAHGRRFCLKARWRTGVVLFIKGETQADCCSQRKYVISRKIKGYHSVLLQEQYPHSFSSMLWFISVFQLCVFAKLLLCYLAWSRRLFLSHWNTEKKPIISSKTTATDILLTVLLWREDVDEQEACGLSTNLPEACAKAEAPVPTFYRVGMWCPAL